MKEFMDVSRAALRMGAREVQMVCLESRAEMPAFEEEIEEGVLRRDEDASFARPEAIHGQERKADGARRRFSALRYSTRTSASIRSSSRARRFVIPCDTVILAIGQTSDLSFLKPQDGVETTRQGTLKIDPDTLMTTAPGIFAAGDIAFGPRLIINAVADGKKAAEEIDSYLRGPEWKPKPRYVQITVLDHHEMAAHYDEYSRLAVPALPLDRRTGVAEVETGYTEEQAREEASPLPAVLDQYDFRGQRNQRHRVHPLRRLRGRLPGELPAARAAEGILHSPTRIKQRLAQRRRTRSNDLQHSAPEELDQMEGSVMVKDETICIRCGLVRGTLPCAHHHHGRL